MRRSNPSIEVSGDADDRGSAALEFILVGLVLLVPIVYLIVALGMIQSQSLGTEAGARHIARAISQAESADDARRSANLVLESVVGEYGMDAATVDFSLACIPAGSVCPSAGATLVVTVRASVALPLVPPILGLDQVARIPVEATSAQKVSRTWGTP
ncbi:TadE family protein [Microbacterium lacus]|uniref:TadE/TadG family type IV pilus assembly protein n=1 Tax=Microbacterium lacus TaxID=415217 RepID=UPI00384BF3BA